MDPKILDDLSRRIVDNLPKGIQALGEDLEKNVRAALQAALGKMQLVSRDEFEVQQAVLARTREKLEHLEQLVDRLEQESNP